MVLTAEGNGIPLKSGKYSITLSVS